MKPQVEIDGAKVVSYAWSGAEPFGSVGHWQIYALAICRYGDSSELYRFSCDRDWETRQDEIYESIDQAKAELPGQYGNVKAKWIEVD